MRQTGNNFTSNLNPLRNEQRQLSNMNYDPYRELYMNNRIQPSINHNLLENLFPARNYNLRDLNLSDSDEEEKKEERRFEFDILNEIEDLLTPDVQFQSNVNEFRTNNRANQLRSLTNNNRIQQQVQNRMPRQ